MIRFLNRILFSEFSKINVLIKMSLAEGKCETILLSASCTDADGQECSVCGEGQNSLMAALLYCE